MLTITALVWSDMFYIYEQCVTSEFVCLNCFDFANATIIINKASMNIKSEIYKSREKKKEKKTHYSDTRASHILATIPFWRFIKCLQYYTCLKIFCILKFSLNLSNFLNVFN